jgi:hypothetical protein
MTNHIAPCEISGSHGGEYEVQSQFWDVLSCSQIDVDRRLEVRTAPIIRAMKESARTSETSVDILLHGSTSQKTLNFISYRAYKVTSSFFLFCRLNMHATCPLIG